MSAATPARASPYAVNWPNAGGDPHRTVRQSRIFRIANRFADGHLARLTALAAELVDHKVELIFAVTAPETRAAKAATKTIPVVFAAHGDPVDSGDVLSFAHPGSNATGLSQMHSESGRKQLEILNVRP